jgi:hypothetical protein
MPISATAPGWRASELGLATYAGTMPMCPVFAHGALDAPPASTSIAETQALFVTGPVIVMARAGELVTVTARPNAVPVHASRLTSTVEVATMLERNSERQRLAAPSSVAIIAPENILFII